MERVIPPHTPPIGGLRVVYRSRRRRNMQMQYTEGDGGGAAPPPL